MSVEPTDTKPTDTALAEDLIAMASRHDALRTPHARHGVLYEPSEPREQAISDRHADRLAAIVEAHGWPGKTLVGEAGAAAAWAVAMHADGRPDAMHAWSFLIERAAHMGEAERFHVAHIMDRVRILRGKLQVYATQFRRGADGVVTPYPYTRDDTIDDRRGSIFLDPLEETLAALRARHPASL